MLIKVQNAKCLTELKKDLSLDEVKEIIFQDFFQDIIDVKNETKRLNEESDGKYPLIFDKIFNKVSSGEKINIDVNNIEFEKSYSARELKEFYNRIKESDALEFCQENNNTLDEFLDKQTFYLKLKQEDLSDIMNYPSEISFEEREKYPIVFIRLTVHFFKLNNKNYFYYTVNLDN